MSIPIKSSGGFACTKTAAAVATDNLIKLDGTPWVFSPGAHTHAWTDITSTPTTLAGYGITDAQNFISAGTTGQYFRGDKTWVTLNTSVVPESGNLYFTNSRGIAATLTGYTSGSGTITSSDTILSAIQKLSGNVSAGEPIITAGTTAQYWRGDKSWQTLNQAAVAGLTTSDGPTFAGLTSPTLIFGSGGPLIKNSTGTIQFRTTGDADFAPIKTSSLNVSINDSWIGYTGDTNNYLSNTTYFRSSGTTRTTIYGGTGQVVLNRTGTLSWCDNDSSQSGTVDLYLYRGSTGWLQQRNGTNPQTFSVFGSYTDASNFKRVNLTCSATTASLIAMTNSGDIDINITPAGAGIVYATGIFKTFVADSVGSVLFSGTSKALRLSHYSTHVGIDATDNTGTLTYQPLTLGGTELQFYTNGTLIGGVVSGAVYGALLKANASNGFASVQVVHPTGNSYRWALANNDTCLFQKSTDKFVVNSTNLITVATDNTIAFLAGITATTGTFSGALTLGTSGILVGGTNLIEQRNFMSAQTFRVYGSYFNESNYARATLSATTGSVTLGFEAAGFLIDELGADINITAAGGGRCVLTATSIASTNSRPSLEIRDNGSTTVGGALSLTKADSTSMWRFGLRGADGSLTDDFKISRLNSAWFTTLTIEKATGNSTFAGGITATTGTFSGITTTNSYLAVTQAVDTSTIKNGLRIESSFGIGSTMPAIRWTGTSLLSMAEIYPYRVDGSYRTDLNFCVISSDGGMETVMQLSSGKIAKFTGFLWATNTAMPAGGTSNGTPLIWSRGSGSSTGSWKGRIVAGGDNVAFLMGEYNSEAWLGGHNAALNAWQRLKINPDGTAELHLGNLNGGGAGVAPILNISNSTGVSTFSGAVTSTQYNVVDSNSYFHKSDSLTLRLVVQGTAIWSAYNGDMRMVGNIEISNTKALQFNPTTAGSGGTDVSIYRSAVNTLTLGNGGVSGNAGKLIAYDLTAASTVQGGNVFATGAIGVNTNSASAHILWGAAGDVTLYRDAADALALRRSANAQTFRVYGSYTDASNYSRASLSCSTTALTLAFESNTGNGDVVLTPKGTGSVYTDRTASGTDTFIANKQHYTYALSSASNYNATTVNQFNYFVIGPASTGTNTGNNNTNQYNQSKQTGGTGGIDVLYVQRNYFECAGGSTVYGSVIASSSEVTISGGTSTYTNVWNIRALAPTTTSHSGTIATYTGIESTNLVGTNITTAYAARLRMDTATGRWNLYADGTAQNYFAGGVSIGTTTATSAGRLLVNDQVSCSRIDLGAGGGNRQLERCGLISNDSVNGIVFIPSATNWMEQRNGSNAQTLRIYGTYTDSANYVRAALSSSTSAITLAAETDGSGSDNINVNINAAGSGIIYTNKEFFVGAPGDKIYFGDVNNWIKRDFTTGNTVLNSPGSFSFDYYSAPKMYIDGPNGRVGIGTVSPGTKLDVNGVIQTNNAVSFNTDISKSTSALLYRNNGNLFFRERQLNSYYERTISNVSTAPADYNKYYQIGLFSFGSLQGIFTVELTFDGGGYGQGARYVIPTSYNNDYLALYHHGLTVTNNVWIVAEGTVQAPRHRLNSSTHWELQYKIIGNGIEFRLVIKGSNGESGTATARVKIYHSDDFANATYTENTGTGTDATAYERLPSIVSAPIGRTLIQNTLNVIGNAGIGTIAPSFKFQVVGGADTWTGIVLGNTSTSVPVIGFRVSDNSERAKIEINDINAATGDRLSFFVYQGLGVGLNERMSLRGNGNLGIGTTTPSTKLDVVGDGRFSTNLRVNNAPAIGTLSVLGVAQASPTLDSTNPSAIRISYTNTLCMDIGGYDVSPYPGYIQMHSTGGPTSYPLALNPLGGEVIVGGTTSSGNTFQVAGTAYITTGMRLGSTYVYGGAANTWEQRNSTTAQTFRLFTSYTDGSNYERLGIASALGNVYIEAQAAGTQLATTPNSTIHLVARGTGTITLRGDGGIYCNNAANNARTALVCGGIDATTGTFNGVVTAISSASAGDMNALTLAYGGTAAGNGVNIQFKPRGIGSIVLGQISSVGDYGPTGKLEFYTTAAVSGAPTLAVRMTIHGSITDGTGGVSIGSTTDPGNGNLLVNGSVTIGTGGPKFKNSSTELQARNNADSAYADLRVNNLWSEASVVSTIRIWPSGISQPMIQAGGSVVQFRNTTDSDFAPIQCAALTATKGTFTAASVESVPAISITGAIYNSGTSTTNKPHVLIEPSGTTSTAWSTKGTFLAVNAGVSFDGNLIDLQTSASSKFKVTYNGAGTFAAGVTATTGTFSGAISGTLITATTGVVCGVYPSVPGFISLNGQSSYSGTEDIIKCVASNPLYVSGYHGVGIYSNGSLMARFGTQSGGVASSYISQGDFGIGIAAPLQKLEVAGNVVLRNSTTATYLHVHGSYTDVGTYSRAALSCSTTALTLAFESNSGNGNISLTPKGTGTVYVDGPLHVNGGAGGTHLYAYSVRGTYHQDATGSGAYIEFTNATTGVKVNNRASGSTPALTVIGASSQTGNMQDWTTSGGTILASINSTGGLTSTTATFSGDLTVGSTTAGANASIIGTWGSELVPALTGGNWTSTNYTVSGGTITHTVGTAGQTTPTTPITFTVGDTYKLTFTVDSYSFAYSYITLAGRSYGIVGTGTYTYYFRAVSNTNLIVSNLTTSDAIVISSLSVKRITQGALTVDGLLTARSGISVEALGIGTGTGLPTAPLQVVDNNGLGIRLTRYNVPTQYIELSENGGAEHIIRAAGDKNLLISNSNSTNFGITYYANPGQHTFGGSSGNYLYLTNNLVEQRNGATAQSMKIYGSYTDSSNYDRLFINTSSGGNYYIGTEAAGTQLGATPNANLHFYARGTGAVYIRSDGGLSVKNIANSAFTSVNCSDVYAGGNGFFNVVKVDSGTGVRIADVSGTLSVETANGSALSGIRCSTGIFYPTANGQEVIRLNETSGTRSITVGTYPSASSYGGLWFGSGTPDANNYSILGKASETIINGGTSGGVWIRTGNSTTLATFNSTEILFTPVASNKVVIRNSTNAQTFQVYGSYTDGSTYKRASLSCDTTALTLAFQSDSGNGDVILTPKGTGDVIVNLPTNNSSVLRVNKADGTIMCQVGTYPGYDSSATMWLGQATPSGTNYTVVGDGGDAILNGTSTASLRIAGVSQMYANSGNIIINKNELFLGYDTGGVRLRNVSNVLKLRNQGNTTDADFTAGAGAFSGAVTIGPLLGKLQQHPSATTWLQWLDAAGSTTSMVLNTGIFVANSYLATHLITDANSVERLYLGTANVLEQRNGLNVQTSRLYASYTDSSNYERLNIISDLGNVYIQAMAAGAQLATNPNSTMHIIGRGTGTIRLRSNGGVACLDSTDTVYSDLSARAGNFSDNISCINVNATGALSGTNLKAVTYSVAIPSGTDGIDLFTVSNSDFSTLIEIGFTVHNSSYAQSKKYIVPLQYGGTSGAWHKLLPISTSGPYSGNDAELDVNISSGTAIIRMRRTSGATSGTARVYVNIIGDPANTTIAASSTTYTTPTVSVTYAPTSLTQRNGYTGILNDNPSVALDVNGYMAATRVYPSGSSNAYITSPTNSLISFITSGSADASITCGAITCAGKIQNTAFSTADSTLRMGSIEIQPYSLNNAWIGENLYYAGGGWTRRATGASGLFYFHGDEGQFRFFTSGTGGTTVTASVQFRVNASGTVALGGNMTTTTPGSTTGAGLIVTGTTAVFAGSIDATLGHFTGNDSWISFSGDSNNYLSNTTNFRASGVTKATINGSTGEVSCVAITATGALSVTTNVSAPTLQAQYFNTSSGQPAGFYLTNGGWSIGFRTNPSKGWFEITDSGGNIQHRWDGGNYLVSSAATIAFSSETNFATANLGAAQLGFSREGANVLELNSGTKVSGGGTLKSLRMLTLKLDTAGPTVKNSSGKLHVRNDADSDYAGVYVQSIYIAPETITYSGTMAIDAGLSNKKKITLGGNGTISNPTNSVDCMTLLFILRQDGTGNRVPVWDTKYRFRGDLATVTLSTGAGIIDRVAFEYDSTDDRWDCISFIRGS